MYFGSSLPGVASQIKLCHPVQNWPWDSSSLIRIPILWTQPKRDQWHSYLDFCAHSPLWEGQRGHPCYNMSLGHRSKLFKPRMEDFHKWHVVCLIYISAHNLPPKLDDNGLTYETLSKKFGYEYDTFRKSQQTEKHTGKALSVLI